MRIVQSFVLAAMALMGSVSVCAAPGDLDTTFGGGDGWVSTGFRLINTSDQAHSIIHQPDGKLVVAGHSTINNDGRQGFALMRYNSDGTLDTTFGNNGKVVTDIYQNVDDYAYSLIRQNDGKLVVTGSSSNYISSLVRYNVEGSLDTTFNGDGILTAIDFSARSVIQQSDGKLVVVGSKYNGANNDFVVARYDINGALDPTFGSNGVIITSVGSTSEGAYAVTQQSDGKLVVAGTGGGSYDFALVRYNSNGVLDATFDGDGKLITNIASDDSAYSVIQQTDGKLVAAGKSNNDFAVVRYNSNGTLDVTFDSDGKVITDIGSSTDIAYKIIQQFDNKLIVVGSSWNGAYYKFSLARYNIDGSLDENFDGDGKLTTSIGVSDTAKDVIQQADGKLVAVGWTQFGPNWQTNMDFSLVRYNSDGSLDISFSDDGKLTTDYGKSIDRARAAIQQSDDKFVVAGTAYADHNNIALARYKIDGTLDVNFGNNGKVNTDVGVTNPECYSITQQSDGKLVAAGYRTNNSDSEILIVRYSIDGTLDSSFDNDGILTSNIGIFNDRAHSLIQQQDGKLVVAGYTGDTYYEDFLVARYNIDGSLDTGFGAGGIVITDIGALEDTAYAVIQQSDGKLVAAGQSWNGSYYEIAVVRYNTNGSLDTDFNNSGILTATALTFHPTNFVTSVIQQADGKIVIAGHSWNASPGYYEFALMRINLDGTLDTSFSGDGLLTTDVNTDADDYAYSVIHQTDGKLVVAGNSYSNNSGRDFVVARYQTDGSLDSSFGDGGKLKIIISGANDYAYSIIQQDDGKLFLAGYSDGMPTGSEFVIARILSGQIDIDGDGVLDINDAFPLDPTESVDTDSDTIGNNADWDDDGDGVPDTVDAAPLDNANTNEIVLPLDGVYKGITLKQNMMAH